MLRGLFALGPERDSQKAPGDSSFLQTLHLVRRGQLALIPEPPTDQPCSCLGAQCSDGTWVSPFQ